MKLCIIFALLSLLQCVRCSIMQNFECRVFRTEPAIDGNTNGLDYLDRHDVNACIQYGGVIHQYRLLRGPTHTTIFYEYTCCRGTWYTGPSVSHQTHFQHDIRFSNTIDRNSIDCPTGSAIQAFHLQTGQVVPGMDRVLWRFNVTCARVNVDPHSCTSIRLDREEASIFPLHGRCNANNECTHSNIVFLDRHNVTCDSGQVMQTSHVQSTAHMEWRGSHRGRMHYWQYTIRCCAAITEQEQPSNSFQWIKIKSERHRQCITVDKNTGSVSLAPCAQATAFFAKPTTYQCGNRQCQGFALRHWASSPGKDYYSPRLLVVDRNSCNNCPSGRFELKSVPESSRDSYPYALRYFANEFSLRYGASPTNDQELSVGFTGSNSVGAFRSGSTSGVGFRVFVDEVDNPPSVINNFGDICSQKGKSYNWNQKACPFAHVSGVGGLYASPEEFLPRDLSNMPFFRSATFYYNNDGIHGAFMQYNTRDRIFTGDFNPGSFQNWRCSLQDSEHINRLYMLPNTSSSNIDIVALRWRGSKGSTCVIPPTLQYDDPVFQRAIPVNTRSGLPVGMITAKRSNQRISALGLIFYDNIVKQNTDVNWNDAAATAAFRQGRPRLSQSYECSADWSSSGTSCSNEYSFTREESYSFENAYTSSSEYAREVGLTHSWNTELRVSLKFGAGTIFEKEAGISVGYGGERTNTETWTTSQSTSQTNAVVNMTSDTQTFSSTTEVKPGQACTTRLIAYFGRFGIPWNGDFSYKLQSGAEFKFPTGGRMEGELTSQVFSHVSCRDLPTPPLQGARSPSTAPESPSPASTVSPSPVSTPSPSPVIVSSPSPVSTPSPVSPSPAAISPPSPVTIPPTVSPSPKK